MPGSASARKLLSKLRNSKVGWTPQDLEQILVGHGFTRKKEARHGAFYEHPDYPADAIVIIPRHSPCKTWVALKVLKAVELVVRRENPPEDGSQT